MWWRGGGGGGGLFFFSSRRRHTRSLCDWSSDGVLFRSLFPSDDFETVAIIPIGHVAADCPHAEKKRKPMAEIVEEI